MSQSRFIFVIEHFKSIYAEFAPTFIPYPCGVDAKGDPHTATISDLLCVPM
jgi:hypothetical protein